MSYPIRWQRQGHDATSEQRLISVGDLEDDPRRSMRLQSGQRSKSIHSLMAFPTPSKQEIASGKSRQIHHLDLEICKAVAIDVTGNYPTPEVKFTCFAVERTAADK